MLITIIILVLSAVFFVNGKIRSDLVALCALVALLIFQILTPDEALSGFSNSVVIMMVGLFVVGGAIFQTGLAKMISSHILKLAGKSELKLFLLVMLVTSAIGGVVCDNGRNTVTLDLEGLGFAVELRNVRCRLLGEVLHRGIGCRCHSYYSYWFYFLMQI